MASLREFALYVLVSLFSCFGPCFHTIMELIDSEKELFLTEFFSQEVLEPNFSKTYPQKTSAVRRMIAIVDDEERHLEYRK